MEMKRIIKLTLPAQTVKMTGELGAIFGQYNLNVIKFCQEFNAITENLYESNMMLRVAVMVLENNKFEIQINGPTTLFLLHHFIKTKTINLLDLIHIAYIMNAFTNDPFLSQIKSLYSYIRKTSILIN